MADPLSIAASIAGLVALADTLFRSVVRFQREVRGASEDIANIATELRDLSGVLHNLSLLASALETGREEATFRLHHVNSCRQSILDIQSKLSKELDSLNAPKTTKSIMRRLLWPYTTRETQSILGDISRHKSTMTLALTADSMKAMMKCLSNHTELSQELSEIREGINQAKEIATNIAMDERRQKVLDFFLVVNPQKNLDVTLRLRYPLTGLWLTDSDAFHQWMYSPNAKLWLSGIPGAGKTVLAGLITQEVLQHVVSSDNHGACFFFCDYKDPTSHLLANILSSLASQLARQNNDAFETLQNYYEYLHPSLGMPGQPDEEKLREMFLEMVKAFNHVYIAIDGLDECGTDPSVTIGLHSIVSTSDLVSLAILSRDELHIRERLEDTFEHIEIAARSGDIRLYVAAELELRIKEKRLRIRNASLKDQIIERLVNGAKGMFRWASCQVDYLCEMPTDREIRDALGKLPPTLPASYERILRRRTDPRSVQIIRTTLRLLCLARPFLTIEELCDVVSLPEDVSRIEPEDVVHEDVIASLCGSLIRRTYAFGDPIFELAHFTVKEFIQSGCLKGTDLEVYAIDPKEGNEYVAALSLKFLSLDNFNDTRMRSGKQLFDATDEVAERHPFHTYASIHWQYWSLDLPRFAAWEPHCRFLAPGIPGLPHLGRPLPAVWASSSNSNSNSDSKAAPVAESDSDSSSDADSEILHGTPDRHYRRAIAPELVANRISPVLPGAFDLAMKLFKQEKSPAFTLWCAQFIRIYSNHNLRRDQKGKTFEDLFEIMSTLLHSSFTPLHMASALNLPSIVESLLQKGADPQSECGFGSALQCAVMGLLCWAKADEDAIFWADSEYHGAFIRTISAMNKYGLINTNLVDRQGRTLSVFDAVLIRFGQDHKIALKLLVSLAEMSSIFRPTSVFLERFKEWTTDSCVSWLPQIPRYLRKLMEVTGRLTIVPDLSSQLKEIVEAVLEKHESYAGEIAIPTHRSISDSDYFEELMMALERDDSVLLNRLSSDSRIWDLHKGHKFGASALHVAAYHGSTKVVQQLLGLGFNVSGRDQHGKLPLHYCCRPFSQQGTLNPKQSIKSAVALLEAGASDMAADDDGNTIWHLAASAGWERLISYLLQRDAGAEGSKIGRTPMNGDGFSPIGLALLRRRIQVAILLLPRYGACLDSEGHSVHPYRVAAEVGSEELLQALSEAGVPMYPKCGSSLKIGTPLHLLECGSSLSCVRRLKALFPEACAEIFKGMTPFETLIFRSLEREAQTKPLLDKAILAELLPATFKQDAEKRRQLWKSLCQKLTTTGYLAPSMDSSIPDSIATILEIGFDYSFVRLSERDEEPLTEFFHALKKLIYLENRRIIHTPRLQKVILEQLLSQENVSDYDPLRVPEWILVLLELSVALNWDKIVAEILRRKVSIHDRSAVRDTSQWPRSAIETACASAPFCPRGIFEQLLAHSESHRMNEIHPFYGDGLIHMFVSICHPSVSTDLREKFGMLLKKGVAINLRDIKRSAPGILRCRGGTAKLLLDHGADPCLEDKYGFNAMFTFALKADISNLAILKDRFGTIDWNKTFPLDTLGNSGMWTRKTGSCNILHVACIKGSLVLAKFLLENTPCNNLDAATERGYTCSHLAASALDGGKVLEHLQARGADMNPRSLRGESPLHIAVLFRRRCNVQTLLQLGADPVAVDNAGYTPAARALVLGFSEISDIFGDHWVSSSPKGSGPCIIENTTSALLPALYTSIIREDFRGCQKLWSMGCPLNKPIRSCGRCTALDWAVTRGWKGSKPKEIMLWLLHNSGTTWTEICPEHNGSSDDEDAIGIIQYVIKYEAFNDVLEAFLNQYLPFWPEWLADTEDSATYLALKNNNLEGLRILLDWVDRQSKGEDRCLKSVHPAVPTLDSMFNSKRRTPLLCFAISWSGLDLTKLLVKYGASVDIQGEEGESPLRIAAADKLHIEAEFLLDQGANPNVRDDESDTPLILAVINGDKAMIELLVSRGADLSVRDWLGNSLLTHCSTRDLFQYILELGVNPSTKNFVGNPELYNALGNYDLGMFMLQKSLIQTHNPEEKLDLSHFGDSRRITLLYQILPKMIRVLGKDKVKSMISTELTKGISPLCDAARRGYPRLLGTLLDLGAEIEFQGHPLGTALMVASIHGELSCVRDLVRRGAAIYYQTRDSNYPSRSALANAEQYPEIRRWILVERYTEQAKISHRPFESIDVDGNTVRPWSGIRQVQYPLVGARARSRFESSFQFLCRLSGIRRSMRGTVVQYDTLWE